MRTTAIIQSAHARAQSCRSLTVNTNYQSGSIALANCLLGDFNARVGRSVEVDDVISTFGEDTCSANDKEIYFLPE